jgi:enolase-phosphatase E1
MENIQWQMSIDRKTTELKAFQGFIWKEGFESGELVGFVYDDVVRALKSWKKREIPVYIYSSGSVEAQKLLFGHTQDGNLLEYLEGHYDTKIGSKLEKESYERIVADISSKKNVKADDILFVSDNVLELEAAQDAGLQVCLAVRPGNPQTSTDNGKKFKPVQTFDILFDKFQ